MAGPHGPTLTAPPALSNLRAPLKTGRSMRPAAVIATAFAALLAAAPVAAQEAPRLAAQVALLPMPERGLADVEALVRSHWKAHYETGHEDGFTREHLRAGRFDLDDDGRPELFVMIDKENWVAEHGKPFVVAEWGGAARGWYAIGWGWSDEDTIFATTEKIAGWRSIETNAHLLRWDGKGAYRPDARP